MRPFFQIFQGETDVTDRAGRGNVSLTVTDGTGTHFDTIQYEISDENGVIAPPRTGVDVRVIGGYRERQPRQFGIFTVDQVELIGWPQIISVNGQSANAMSVMKEPRARSYKAREFPTYGDLIDEIAQRNGLASSMIAEIRAKPLEFEAQQEEDDIQFLTRIGDRTGFDVTIKGQQLVITKRGFGQSAGGLLLPLIEIAMGRNIVSYAVSRQDKPKYGKVKASWFDREKVETKTVDAASSKDGPDFLIRMPFKSEEEALDAARAKADDLRRGTATAEFTIDGNEQARAEAFVEVSGVRSLIDGRWRAKDVTHSFSASGPYTTTISCELPGAEQ